METTKPKRQYRKRTQTSKSESPKTESLEKPNDVSASDSTEVIQTQNSINGGIVVPKERKRKYASAEQAHEAKIEQMRQWRQNRKARTLTIDFGSEEIKLEFLELIKDLQASESLKAVLNHLNQ